MFAMWAWRAPSACTLPRSSPTCPTKALTQCPHSPLRACTLLTGACALLCVLQVSCDVAQMGIKAWGAAAKFFGKKDGKLAGKAAKDAAENAAKEVREGQEARTEAGDNPESASAEEAGGKEAPINGETEESMMKATNTRDRLAASGPAAAVARQGIAAAPEKSSSSFVCGGGAAADLPRQGELYWGDGSSGSLHKVAQQTLCIGSRSSRLLNKRPENECCLVGPKSKGEGSDGNNIQQASL